MCGAPVKKPVYYEVEGTIMILCDKCAKYGKRVPGPIKHISSRNKTQRNKHKPVIREIIEWELVSNYGERIRRARERLGMSQEDLSRIIGEPLSYIKKIERQKIYPSEIVVNKLEKILGIKLKSSIIETSALGNELESMRDAKESTTSTKLGDILVFRRDKKKSKRK